MTEAATPTMLTEKERTDYRNRMEHPERPWYPNLHKYSSEKRMKLAIQHVKSQEFESNFRLYL
jgi:hypothetical protein